MNFMKLSMIIWLFAKKSENLLIKNSGEHLTSGLILLCTENWHLKQIKGNFQ